MKPYVKPSALLGLGIGCMIISTIEGIIYAPDAKDAIEDRKKELDVEKLPIGELIKTGGPYLIPSVTAGIAGTSLILASTNEMINIGAGAMTACTIAETSLREWREKTKEIAGSKKEQKIRESIAADALARNPKGDKQVYITGKGNYLIMDNLTGRYFLSNIDELKKIENELNAKMLRSDFVSQNEYCFSIGLGPIKMGDERGWIVDGGLLDFRFTPGQADDGTPCQVLDIDRELRDL